MVLFQTLFCAGNCAELFDLFASRRLVEFCYRTNGCMTVQVDLQRIYLVSEVRNICDRITSRLNLWNRGAYDKLVQYYYSTAEAFLGDNWGTKTQEKRHGTLSNLILRGKLLGVV